MTTHLYLRHAKLRQGDQADRPIQRSYVTGRVLQHPVCCFFLVLIDYGGAFAGRFIRIQPIVTEKPAIALNMNQLIDRFDYEVSMLIRMAGPRWRLMVR